MSARVIPRTSPHPPRMRPPRALVLAEPPEERGAEVDWSPWYLFDEQDMAHAPEHNRAAKIFVSSVQYLARERGDVRDYVGSDEFFAWVPRQPLVRVSPDVFLLRDPPPPPYPRSWHTWLPGHHPPRFALEIVSEDWKKDYEDNPAKYWQLGTQELVIFDAEADGREAPQGVRVPLQIYQRDEDGAFVRVYAGPGPARSEELGVWLVVRSDGVTPRLRLARDPAGEQIVPTTEEALAKAEDDKARLAAKLRALGVDPEETR